MGCPRCGTEVSEHQKFCHECGTALSPPASDNTTTADDALDAPTEPVGAVAAESPEPSAPDEMTEPGEAAEPHETAELPEPTDPDQAAEPPEPTDPDQAAEPDEPAELPEPTVLDELAEPPEPTDPDQAAQLPEPTEPTEPLGLPEPTEPVELPEPVGMAATTEMAETPAASDATAPSTAQDEPTEPLVAMQAPTDATSQQPAPPEEPPTTPVETLAPPVTAEMPALFDGHDDLAEYPEPREPFQIRVIFLLAVFGAAAMLMSIVADVIDIRTTRPAPGISTGQRTLEDLGSNLGLAGFIGTAVMVLGGLLACFGLRWGAGLAGGAGLALAGWAGLTIGLAELPIAIAESITRTSSVEFTLRVTRDIGFWLIVGVGVIGIVVFLASLRSIGTGGRVALNPLVAAVTAVAMVTLAFGPLVPVNNAVFADNFRSVDPTRDLPAAFFAGRLGQVGLIALAGVAGMLIVRSYGLGLAVGGVSVSVWLWVSSLAEIGTNPVGIADRNPGADNTVPHAVTTVGMVATLALLAIAAALATYRLTRADRRP